jgi:hypothetical protein
MAQAKQGRPPIYSPVMVRISITSAAFDAISATLPLGSVGFEREPNANGEVMIWVEQVMANRLADLRGPGENVILRLVAMEGGRRGLCLSGLSSTPTSGPENRWRPQPTKTAAITRWPDLHRRGSMILRIDGPDHLPDA